MSNTPEIIFDPISVVVAGPYLYRVYFDDIENKNQYAFRFDVDKKTAVIVWEPEFSNFVAGNMELAKPLLECIAALDSIQNKREINKVILNRIEKRPRIQSAPTEKMVGRNKESGLMSRFTKGVYKGEVKGAPRKQPLPKEIVFNTAALESQEEDEAKEIVNSIAGKTIRFGQSSESRAKDDSFIPLAIEFLMPGLYKVEYQYSGRLDSISFHVVQNTVNIETVDQKKWFALKKHVFSDSLFIAISALDKARKHAPD